MILDNIYLILLIPFWIFLIIMLGRFFSVYVNKVVIYALTLFSSLMGAVLSGLALLKSNNQILESQVPFIKINDFIISAGLHVDKTALVFAFVLFVISFLVQVFSISYMKKEKKTYRFYALLNLFNFAMAGLFFSPNLFQMYVFWELVGVVSYLLIGFEYFKEKKSLASKKVFLINRIGDTAFICAILLCSYFMYSYSGNWGLTTLSFIDMNIISTLVSAYTATPLFWAICILFIIAAAVKSAQFPFYTWLQDAMEAKLPVSALLHSATMVASGVFLIVRLYPFFSLDDGLLRLIAVLGLVTAIMCSLCACAQVHPKKVLAYSTSAQLGLMFFALGMGEVKAAVVLFVAHAVIKSGLFLCLPREILTPHPDPVLDYSGEHNTTMTTNPQGFFRHLRVLCSNGLTPSRKSALLKEREEDAEARGACAFSYWGFVLFLLGGLSLSGIIFSGMVAKEFLYMDLSLTLKVIFCLISFLTAFYIIKIALVVGVNKDDKKIPAVPIVLTILNIVFYFYIRRLVKFEVSEPFWAALTAWICVYVLYIKDAFWKVPIFYPITFNGFYLDKFYTNTVAAIYARIANFANKIDTKILSNYKPIIAASKFGVRCSDFIETKIMNGTVNLITSGAKLISKIDLKAQNGNIQRYNAYAFIITTIIIIAMIIGYICLYLFYMGKG